MSTSGQILSFVCALSQCSCWIHTILKIQRHYFILMTTRYRTSLYRVYIFGRRETQAYGKIKERKQINWGSRICWYHQKDVMWNNIMWNIQGIGMLTSSGMPWLLSLSYTRVRRYSPDPIRGTHRSPCTEQLYPKSPHPSLRTVP